MKNHAEYLCGRMNTIANMSYPENTANPSGDVRFIPDDLIIKRQKERACCYQH